MLKRHNISPLQTRCNNGLLTAAAASVMTIRSPVPITLFTTSSMDKVQWLRVPGGNLPAFNACSSNADGRCLLVSWWWTNRSFSSLSSTNKLKLTIFIVYLFTFISQPAHGHPSTHAGNMQTIHHCHGCHPRAMAVAAIAATMKAPDGDASNGNKCKYSWSVRQIQPTLGPNFAQWQARGRLPSRMMTMYAQPPWHKPLTNILYKSSFWCARPRSDVCECVTAGCKAFSLANVKGMGTNDWVIRYLY